MSRATDLIQLVENIDEGVWDAVKGAASKAAQFLNKGGTGTGMKPKAQTGDLKTQTTGGDLYKGSPQSKRDFELLNTARLKVFGSNAGFAPENVFYGMKALAAISKYFPYQKERQQLLAGLKKFTAPEYQSKWASDPNYRGDDKDHEAALKQRHAFYNQANELVKKMIAGMGVDLDKNYWSSSNDAALS